MPEPHYHGGEIKLVRGLLLNGLGRRKRSAKLQPAAGTSRHLLIEVAKERHLV